MKKFKDVFRSRETVNALIVEARAKDVDFAIDSRMW